MEMRAVYFEASAQIWTGKCWFFGIVGENKTVNAYNVEVSTSAATANKVGYRHENDKGYILPKGIPCTNGIYATTDSGNAMIYFGIP